MSRPLRPVLPQHDPDPNARNAAIAKARSAYQPMLDSIPGVALAREVPKAESPSMKWYALLGKACVTVSTNQLANKLAWEDDDDELSYGGPGDEAASEAELEAALAEEDAFAEGLAWYLDDADDDLLDYSGADGPEEDPALDTARARRDDETAELRTHVEERIAGILGPRPESYDEELSYGLGGVLTGRARGPHGRPRALADYRALFRRVPCPSWADRAMEDDSFARLRVAGPNPHVLERVERLPDKLPVSDARFKALFGAADSLDAACAEGRMYMVDFAIMEAIEEDHATDEPRYGYAPLAVFAVPRGGRSLRPVAVQCGQIPDERINPVFYPGDGWAWTAAKTVFNLADVNFHEVASHLARTHMLVEATVLATRRNLAPNHPLHVLLHPHFEGTLAINQSANTNLIAPGGAIDRMFFGRIDSNRELVAKALQTHHFREGMLPNALKRQGIDDTTALPDYPYRDDGLLIWDATRRWVGSYLAHYYQGDAAVQADSELACWAAALAPDAPGGLTGFGPIGSLDSLVDAVTMIVFTASAQHSAVNFPQFDIISYAPAYTGSTWAPAPMSAVDATEQTFLDMLPPLELAQEQLETLYVLGSIHHTQLGVYQSSAWPYRPWFRDPIVTDELLPSFRAALAEIEAHIAAVNADPARRPVPYTYLMPSQITQSINI